jgi:putative transposase
VYTTAPNGYCWREKNNALEIPKNSRGSKINLIGSVNYATGKVDYEAHTDNINGQTVLCYLEKMALYTQEAKIKMMIVMDNASWHKSALIIGSLERLAKLGLTVSWLPTYSPELNPMETVWRVLKYHLLPRRFYDLLKELREDVLAIMDDICVKGKLVI